MALVLSAVLASWACSPIALARTFVQIDEAPRHLGPGEQHGGTSFQTAFELDELDPDIYLEVRFVGPAGPNQSQPPQMYLNGQPTTSIAAFMPEYRDGDDRWHTNPDGTRDFNGTFATRIPVSHLLQPGSNEFRIVAGRPDDAFSFRGVRIRSIRSELRLLAWNVESGDPSDYDPHNGNAARTIARELFDLADYDVVGLSEVRVGHIPRFVAALTAGGAGPFRSIHSGTGNDDRLVLAYDTSRVDLVAGYELHAAQDNLLNSIEADGEWRHRSPLVGHFQHRDTRREFLCVVNHLARGDETVRLRQAIGLWDWAARQRAPLIALGDFNFDYDFATSRGNAAYVAFTRRGRWKWIEPKELIDSNWADAKPNLPAAERTDQYPGSILDFVFAAGGAQQWPATSQVIVRANDFPDTGETSDHRPVEAVFQLPIR
jgi:endonuclease/exonuclease/phosphatase family metal-dependent hydrolase